MRAGANCWRPSDHPSNALRRCALLPGREHEPAGGVQPPTGHWRGWSPRDQSAAGLWEIPGSRFSARCSPPFHRAVEFAHSRY